MSEYGSPSDVWGKSDRTYPTPTLGLGAVGSYFDKPPQTDDNHDPAFVVAYGILLDRSAYAVLWMTAQKMGWVQPEANWQAAKTLSPIGAVSFYSDGTNNTNFRTPSVGTGGFKRVLGEDNVAPVGDIEGGFNFQLGEHQHATPIIDGTSVVGRLMIAGEPSANDTPFGATTFNSLPGSSRVGYNFYNPDGGDPTTEITAATRSLLTSKTLFNSVETTPQGFYVKTFIYTGADITKPAAAPSLQQLLTMAQMPKLLWNTDLGGNPVNQMGFSGDWASIAVDEQGYDLWRKYDETRMCQIVKAGNYLPNTDYVLQYNNAVVWRGRSPADGGNWGIAIPNTAVKVDLRPGVLQVPWHPEEYMETLRHCHFQYKLNESLFGGVKASNNYWSFQTLGFRDMLKGTTTAVYLNPARTTNQIHDVTNTIYRTITEITLLGTERVEFLTGDAEGNGTYGQLVAGALVLDSRLTNTDVTNSENWTII